MRKPCKVCQRTYRSLSTSHEKEILIQEWPTDQQSAPRLNSLSEKFGPIKWMESPSLLDTPTLMYLYYKTMIT